MDSGLSARIPISQVIFVRSQYASIIGDVYRKPTRANPGDNLEPTYFTHNTLLGALWDGRLTGGVIYVCRLSYANFIGIQGYCETDKPFYLAYFICDAVFMLNGTDKAITGPRGLWIIFRLQLAILIARSIKHSPVQAHLFTTLTKAAHPTMVELRRCRHASRTSGIEAPSSIDVCSFTRAERRRKLSGLTANGI